MASNVSTRDDSLPNSDDDDPSDDDAIDLAVEAGELIVDHQCDWQLTDQGGLLRAKQALVAFVQRHNRMFIGNETNQELWNVAAHEIVTLTGGSDKCRQLFTWNGCQEEFNNMVNQYTGALSRGKSNVWPFFPAFHNDIDLSVIINKKMYSHVQRLRHRYAFYSTGPTTPPTVKDVIDQTDPAKVFRSACTSETLALVSQVEEANLDFFQAKNRNLDDVWQDVVKQMELEGIFFLVSDSKQSPVTVKIVKKLFMMVVDQFAIALQYFDTFEEAQRWWPLFYRFYYKLRLDCICESSAATRICRLKDEFRAKTVSSPVGQVLPPAQPDRWHEAAGGPKDPLDMYICLIESVKAHASLYCSTCPQTFWTIVSYEMCCFDTVNNNSAYKWSETFAKLYKRKTWKNRKYTDLMRTIDVRTPVFRTRDNFRHVEGPSGKTIVAEMVQLKIDTSRIAGPETRSPGHNALNPASMGLAAQVRGPTVPPFGQTNAFRPLYRPGGRGNRPPVTHQQPRASLVSAIAPHLHRSSYTAPRPQAIHRHTSPYDLKLKLIAFVKYHAQFPTINGQIPWTKIDEEMRTVNCPLDARNEFHLLLQNYLTVLGQVSNLEEARRRWPPFVFLHDLSLTPFMSLGEAKAYETQRDRVGRQFQHA